MQVACNPRDNRWRIGSRNSGKLQKEGVEQAKGRGHTKNPTCKKKARKDVKGKLPSKRDNQDPKSWYEALELQPPKVQTRGPSTPLSFNQYIQVEPGKPGAEVSKGKKSISQIKNLPIECAQGDQPLR